MLWGVQGWTLSEWTFIILNSRKHKLTLELQFTKPIKVIHSRLQVHSFRRGNARQEKTSPYSTIPCFAQKVPYLYLVDWHRYPHLLRWVQFSSTYYMECTNQLTSLKICSSATMLTGFHQYHWVDKYTQRNFRGIYIGVSYSSPVSGPLLYWG